MVVEIIKIKLIDQNKKCGVFYEKIWSKIGGKWVENGSKNIGKIWLKKFRGVKNRASESRNYFSGG